MVEDLKITAEILKEPNPEGAAMILNTTSAALEGEAVPVQWYRADKRAIAYDISYGEELSPFLLQAGLAGLKVTDGLEMLVAQGARSYEWWLGMAAPLDVMRRAVG
jgi:shikimate dehydrogenase